MILEAILSISSWKTVGSPKKVNETDRQIEKQK